MDAVVASPPPGLRLFDFWLYQGNASHSSKLPHMDFSSGGSKRAVVASRRSYPRPWSTEGIITQARTSRTLRVIGFNIVLVLVGAELVAWGVARYRWGVGYRTVGAVMQEYLETLPQSAEGSREEGPAPQNVGRTFHPFFGFTYEPGQDASINNRGFLEPRDLPYRPRPGEFVVGVFGGSVARDLRLPGAWSVLEGALSESLAPKGYDRITLLMFAQGGWRQPQQLFCFLYHLDSIDMAVFLEGFNEIGQLPLHDDPAARGRPWAFPAPRIYEALLARSRSTEVASRALRIREIRARQLESARPVSHGLLGRSMLAHVLWRIRNDRLEATVRRLTEEIEGLLPSADRVAAYPDDLPLETMERVHLNRYARWIQTAREAGLAQGKPVAFFLQPSQYLDGAKPVSDREAATAMDRASELGPRVNGWYPKLKGLTLPDGSPAFVDLTNLFQDTPETMYRDSCCHLTGRGMTRVAEAIASELTSGEVLGPVAPADSRAPAWGVTSRDRLSAPPPTPARPLLQRGPRESSP